MFESIAIILLCLVTFLAIFNPLMGLYGFFAIAYIRPQDYYPFLKGVEPAKWILIITFISFILQRFKTQEGFVKAKQNWGILAILFCILISKINVIEADRWLSATEDFIQICIVYFLMINIFTTRKKLRNFYVFFLLINLIIAFRFFNAYKTGTAGIQGGKPGDTSLGFLGNADDLGIGMAIAFAYAVAAIFFAKGLFLKALAFFASGGFIWSAMNTESRGARLGILAIFITALILAIKPKKFKTRSFFIGVMIALLLLGGFLYKYRWALMDSYETSLNEQDSGRVGRMATWDAAKRMIKENPLIGVGRGNYVPYWRENYVPGVYGYEVAHNVIYEVTAEIGIIGLLAYLFFSLAGLWELKSMHKKYPEELKKDYFLDMIFAIYLVGLTAFYANGMFITVAFYWHIYILVAIFVCAKNIFMKEALAINETQKAKIKLMHVSLGIGMGGLEKLVLELAKGINRDEFSPSVCCLTGESDLSGEFTKSNIPVFYCYKKEGLDYRLGFELARLFKKEKIELLHTHDSTANLYALFAARLAGIKAVINTEHGRILSETKRLQAINKLLSLMNFKMVCVSSAVKTALEKMGIRSLKLAVVPNGIDLNKYNIPVDRKTKREQLASLTSDDFVVCSVGRLCTPKNQKMLLDSAKYFFQVIPEARLLIAGDGSLKEELQNYAMELNIAGKVSFLGIRNDIPQILKISDCFVLSSDYESFGVAILEAMTAGVPVVATDVGGISEIVKDNITGILIPKNDSRALADAIIKIRNNPESYRPIIARAKDNVINNYSIEKTIKAYEELYLAAYGNGNIRRTGLNLPYKL